MTDDDQGDGRRPSDAPGDGHLAERGFASTAAGEPTLRGLPRAGDAGLAPVIPLFGARGRPSSAHPAFGADLDGATAVDEAVAAADQLAAKRPRLRPLRNVGHREDLVASPGTAGLRGEDASSPRVERAPDEVAASEEARERAEAVLLRKLRSRSLSFSEARAVVRGVEGTDDIVVDEIIDRFTDLGYLDDATFAEQLVLSALEKRGEGRRAVAETLRKRGIPRDVAEAALAALPDDDAERALEFARSKVRAVEGAEYDTALRRLAGQLARRGYPSSVALTAARTALAEAGIGRSRSFARPASGVRFTPDE